MGWGKGRRQRQGWGQRLGQGEEKGSGGVGGNWLWDFRILRWRNRGGDWALTVTRADKCRRKKLKLAKYGFKSGALQPCKTCKWSYVIIVIILGPCKIKDSQDQAYGTFWFDTRFKTNIFHKQLPGGYQWLDPKCRSRLDLLLLAAEESWKILKQKSLKHSCLEPHFPPRPCNLLCVYMQNSSWPQNNELEFFQGVP